MSNNKQEVVARLMDVGIKYGDAVKLREIAMTLHRWHELECGDGNGHIEREEDGTPYYYNSNARYVDPQDPRRRSKIPDKETGAIKRLQAIINQYTDLTYYIQGDPRGASLYILRPKDIPVGESIQAYYSRGIAVYK